MLVLRYASALQLAALHVATANPALRRTDDLECDDPNFDPDDPDALYHETCDCGDTSYNGNSRFWQVRKQQCISCTDWSELHDAWGPGDHYYETCNCRLVR